MKRVDTFNSYHLGDNLVHLNFLRRLAQKYPDREFGHYSPTQHNAQLAPLYEGVPNLKQLFECPSDAINAWRGDMHYWHMHEQRNNFTWFHFDWFRHLAGKMGLESPIETVDDMLFDYPELNRENASQSNFDYLLVNSIPHSAQALQYNKHEFDRLASEILASGKTVITTFPTNSSAPSTHDGTAGLSITAIGRLSKHCGAIIGIPTGPIWTTYNAANAGKKRVLMLDSETVLIEPNSVHVQNVQGIRREIFK